MLLIFSTTRSRQGNNFHWGWVEIETENFVDCTSKKKALLSTEKKKKLGPADPSEKSKARTQLGPEIITTKPGPTRPEKSEN